MKNLKRLFIILIFSLLNAMLFAQPRPEPPKPEPPRPVPPAPPEKIINYRGNRIVSQNIPLVVNYIKCRRENDEDVSVEIIFNMNIDPRSVNTECFLIDSEPLSESVNFSFNKRGDTIRFVIPMEKNECLINMKNIRAFDQTPMQNEKRKVKVK